jgi:hypothetical protein
MSKDQADRISLLKALAENLDTEELQRLVNDFPMCLVQALQDLDRLENEIEPL